MIFKTKRVSGAAALLFGLFFFNFGQKLFCQNGVASLYTLFPNASNNCGYTGIGVFFELTICEGQTACLQLFVQGMFSPGTFTTTITQTNGPDIVWVEPYFSNQNNLYYAVTPPIGTTVFTIVSIVSSTGQPIDIVGQPVTITVLPGVTNLAIAQNGQACFDQTTQLVASAGNATSYQWSNGVSGPTNSVFQPGNYSVTATAANGCSSVATTTVVNPLPLSLIILPTSNLCQGQPATATVQPATGATFVWSNGQTGPTTTFTPPATFSVTATASANCTATASVTFPGFPPPVPGISGAGFICPGQTVNLATIGSFLSYSWSNGAQTPAIQTTAPGSFSVTVTDVFGCTGSSTTTVTAAVAPTISLSAMPDVCQNACQNITATLTGTPPFSFLYQIQQGGAVLSSQTVVAPSSPHVFSVCPPGPPGNSVQIVACTVNDAVCP